ncbi:Armadillo-type fold [Pseudocohnilembus persalinus]|uniref:Armadillo-type fold n=1 Tax=Pseudocohnilembus persalinus TaxID=266149 RepID=A0A0V0Q812_PSEPJ|nr:Armadillo-type fold [Pseudocohnilembus persalinus]|eukprot:KRW98303.1 Armadillo-type fold [Pseudocohnilembus persalinus]
MQNKRVEIRKNQNRQALDKRRFGNEKIEVGTSIQQNQELLDNLYKELTSEKQIFQQILSVYDSNNVQKVLGNIQNFCYIASQPISWQARSFAINIIANIIQDDEQYSYKISKRLQREKIIQVLENLYQSCFKQKKDIPKDLYYQIMDGVIRTIYHYKEYDISRIYQIILDQNPNMIQQEIEQGLLFLIKVLFEQKDQTGYSIQCGLALIQTILESGEPDIIQKMFDTPELSDQYFIIRQQLSILVGSGLIEKLCEILESTLSTKEEIFLTLNIIEEIFYCDKNDFQLQLNALQIFESKQGFELLQKLTVMNKQPQEIFQQKKQNASFSPEKSPSNSAFIISPEKTQQLSDYTKDFDKKQEYNQEIEQRNNFPKQSPLKVQNKAAGLFTNNNQYLNQVLTKGLKGDFNPIIVVYQELYANINHLIDLFESDKTNKSIQFTLDALKPGLVSKNLDICQWAFRFYSKVAYEMDDKQMLNLTWEWFSDEQQGGLKSFLLGLQRHPDVKELFVTNLNMFGKYNYELIFKDTLKNCLQEDHKQLIKLYMHIIEPLSEDIFSCKK